MQTFRITYLGILASSFFALAYATVGGQYSVNVHFVPPLVTAQCSIAQFWSPPNITCAVCFCMTGSLSRCIPQPGCNPQSQNSTSTTMNPNSTAMPPTATEPNAEGSTMPSSENSPPNPSTVAPEADPPSAASTTAATASEKPPADSSATPPEHSEGGKIRGAKPGKSRRLRYFDENYNSNLNNNIV